MFVQIFCLDFNLTYRLLRQRSLRFFISIFSLLSYVLTTIRLLFPTCSNHVIISMLPFFDHTSSCRPRQRCMWDHGSPLILKSFYISHTSSSTSATFPYKFIAYYLLLSGISCIFQIILITHPRFISTGVFFFFFTAFLSPRLGHLVFVLFVVVDGIPTPCGTAFSIATAGRNLLLTASQVVGPHATHRWYIDRSFHASGWHPDGTPWPVDVVAQGVVDVDDVAVLMLSENRQFGENDMIHVCSVSDIPSVRDKMKLKTYYCPIGDVASDKYFPSLEASPSDWKPAYAIQHVDCGKMWMRNALCRGSSGGVVVDRQGRAVAMHCESMSSSKSLSTGFEEPVNANPGQAADTIRVRSDAISSISSLGDTHRSSQHCPILCLSPIVRSVLDFSFVT